MLAQVLVALATSALTLAAPTKTENRRSAASPSIASVETVAITLNPHLQRDSCISASELINDRVLWLCRDTLILEDETLNDYQDLPVSSTVGWSDMSNGSPLLVPIPADQGDKPITQPFSKQLTLYGQNESSPFLYYAADQCPSSGQCDGPGAVRNVEWPDAPLYITNTASDGTVTGYMYSTRGVTGDNQPATTLYEVTYTPGDDPLALPTATMIAEEFFPRFAWNYGAMGGIIDDGYLYLWGVTYDFGVFNNNQTVGLARVPVGSITNINDYQYYYPSTSTWSSVQPNIYDASANVNIDGIFGQGTFFYSSYYGRYVYVGQLGTIDGEMLIAAATASSPEGPWSAQSNQYQIDPDYSYSLAAHPEMSGNLPSNQIYLTYTQNVKYDNDNQYVTPLLIMTLA
ncbi:hypothetical protein BD324DRAFT_624229 [Kockovaella imperatae]|uniref:DUF4185 domain-containing protein n=1 Tax=Kockovaella imperatae TaxID=4999 RepID=A0A1Y1UIZ8_9TREE|nr:hypothetical protein BD324DRAFT_624229 [Kockovaella imperatae]ORX38021.1 hypothetical protein BD324DRAFT_624229 [Kockovaella imperatae]